MERRARLLVPPMEGKHKLIRLIPIRYPTTNFQFSLDIFTPANGCAISFWTFDVGNLLVLGISLVLGITGVWTYWCWDLLVLGYFTSVGFLLVLGSTGVDVDFGEHGSNWKAIVTNLMRLITKL